MKKLITIGVSLLTLVVVVFGISLLSAVTSAKVSAVSEAQPTTKAQEAIASREL